jgi:hypothetical protein
MSSNIETGRSRGPGSSLARERFVKGETTPHEYLEEVRAETDIEVDHYLERQRQDDIKVSSSRFQVIGRKAIGIFKSKS